MEALAWRAERGAGAAPGPLRLCPPGFHGSVGTGRTVLGNPGQWSIGPWIWWEKTGSGKPRAPRLQSTDSRVSQEKERGEPSAGWRSGWPRRSSQRARDLQLLGRVWHPAPGLPPVLATDRTRALTGPRRHPKASRRGLPRSALSLELWPSARLGSPGCLRATPFPGASWLPAVAQLLSQAQSVGQLPFLLPRGPASPAWPTVPGSESLIPESKIRRLPPCGDPLRPTRPFPSSPGVSPPLCFPPNLPHVLRSTPDLPRKVLGGDLVLFLPPSFLPKPP